jgi:hypothetical protein
MSATFLVDLVSAGVGAVSVAPQTIASATTVNGAGVDMDLSDGPIHGVVLNGDYNSTAAVTITLQESDTSGGTYTNIPDASLVLAADAAANDSDLLFIKADLRSKRWVRASVTVAGSTPSAPIAVAILGRRRILGTGTGFIS